MQASPQPSLRGRPRSSAAHRAILKAALAEIGRTGFRALTIEGIAERAGVGRTTIYRRWPNKAAVVMDAFLTLIGPGTAFPAHRRALTRVKLQMRLQAAFFNSSHGRLIKELLGEAQFDPELAEAFRERWITPRREMTREVLEQAVQQGDLAPDLDYEVAIDLLYAPIYYRLQIGTGPINSGYTDKIFQQVTRALAP